jgi:cyclopropane fatty-acyl-phospholipid synthase-like methyltransferase
LFEIGAAYGFFLEVARPMFASVRGIDVSAEASRHAREQLHLPVETGDFLSAQFNTPIDVLCMWDTIEHLVHPDRYLEKAAGVMSRDAAICITTGDIGSLMARWRGRNWRQIHPPTHLHYFSVSTLTKLLTRCGFRIEHVSHPGMWRSVDTMAHIVLNLRHQQHRVYASLRKLGLLNWHAYLNLGDIMFVIAKRQ